MKSTNECNKHCYQEYVPNKIIVDEKKEYGRVVRVVV